MFCCDREKLWHLLKRNVELIPLANDCSMTTGSMSSFFAINEYDQKAMCLICHESVAEMKRYTVKRHYDSKHKKDFDSAYPGKGERLKEFKKRFDAIVGEAKRVSVFGSRCESSQRS